MAKALRLQKMTVTLRQMFFPSQIFDSDFRGGGVFLSLNFMKIYEFKPA